MKKVSYLGPEGSWSDLCSKLWFPDYVSVPCKSMEEALEKAETGSSDICVIPVENSTEGPVPQVLDMLTDSPLNIVGERIMNIRHSLDFSYKPPMKTLMPIDPTSFHVFN